ncbi:hypothetical protein LEN26_007353 [Aphanomyces euteiches]|nr:hypothetical protein LEN26_007353 [Aphanomyces euteiches]
MLTLFCVVVGDGSPFPVEMDADQSVGDLKDKIKTKNPNSFHCVAKDLDLYVAFKDNAWLESTNPLALQWIEGDTPYEMQKYLVKGMKMNPFSSLAKALPAPPGQDQLHILVVVPKSADSAAMLRTACDLLQVILPHVLMGSRNTISDRNSNFKANLCSFYDCRRQQKRWIRCLVLDILFPASLVAATYLFRNTYLAFPIMQISDIDDVRKGLLLFQPLKDAFDHCHISFIYDKRNDCFYLKLFDPSIRNTPLIDFMRDPKQRQVLMDAISIAKEPCRYDPRQRLVIWKAKH